MNDGGGAWFRPKSNGRGLTPASWQGWLCVLGLVAVLVLTSLLADPWTGKSQGVLVMLRLRASLGLADAHLPFPAMMGAMAVEVVIFYIFASWKSLPRGVLPEEAPPD